MSKSRMSLRACAFIAAALAFCANASAQSGNGYNIGQIRGNVEAATVVQTRNVQVEQPGSQDRAIGTAIGGVLGAVIGNAAAGSKRSSTTRVVTAGLGAALGGYAGNKITQRISQKDAQEVILQLPNGRLVSVVQPLPADHLNPGDSVRVLQQRGQTRVIQTAGTYQPSPSEVSYAQPVHQPSHYVREADWPVQPRTWNSNAAQQWSASEY